MDRHSTEHPTPSVAERALAWARIDLSPDHRQPATGRLVVASIGAIIGSLVADALLVVIGEALFPSTKGYGHFQFSDYGKLTVIGVVIACVAWPIVTRVSSAPRWLFLRLAILVTLVLWLPDLYLLHQGQSGEAVAILMVMHLAIAVVTYNLLVRVAPVRSARRRGRPPTADPARTTPARSVQASTEPATGAASRTSPRPAWNPATPNPKTPPSAPTSQ